jgi:hypothetical protein
LFLLTILNQTQYWSMSISWNHIICGSDIEKDSKFRGLEVFTIYRWRIHGGKIWWKVRNIGKNKHHWDWSDSNIRKNPSKFDKLASYEQIFIPWLCKFIGIGLWGR